MDQSVINNMKQLNCLLIICSCLVQCKNDDLNYIPLQHKDLSAGTYTKYKTLLDTAYAQGDYFTAGFQLANLKADNEHIYAQLTKGAKADKANCQKVFTYYNLFQEHNFLNNIVKSDTLKFIELFELCKDLSGAGSYELFLKAKAEEEADYKARQEELDSSKFDLKLMAELNAIFETDQEIRKRLSKRSNTKTQEEDIYKEMRVIDSINAKKVLALIEKNGYPSKHLVGKDAAFVPALVLHHHGTIEQKKEYRKILQQAVDDGVLGQGSLNMFDKRLDDMILSDESKP